ncbi:lysozyme-like protein [Rhizoclosmatium globosum]|uniref:Lysozyme-like protein n=1 Tax=Rhizoclosmatium globosum TaxID=329046 RepID=A0A1Y2BQH1_9FUNG|nr:lysozyme-like protein [Rhizoclosmatium globosum]|eukprot:ORY36887.1 lysozyme-like protein [Rhizoclosmatium globosum]
MTTCQYKIILKITSFFENSNLNLDFGSCSTTNDGQGISAGFIQFTTCSGSAALVCREYQRLKSGPTFCDTYLPSLDHAANSCQGGNWGQQTPAGLENFCYDWRTASTDTIFQQAQLNVQFSGYFKPAMDIFTQYGVKSPLTMGQVYDACVQLGCSAAATLADRASRYAGGSPAGSNPVSEDRWLNAYLIQRESYLDFLGGAYAATKYRVRAYFSMQTNPTFVNDWVVMNVLYDNGSTDRETITC